MGDGVNFRARVNFFPNVYLFFSKSNHMLACGCRRRDIVAARRMALPVWGALNRHRVKMARYLKVTSQAASELLRDRTKYARMLQRVGTLLVRLGEKVDADE